MQQVLPLLLLPLASSLQQTSNETLAAPPDAPPHSLHPGARIALALLGGLIATALAATGADLRTRTRAPPTSGAELARDLLLAFSFRQSGRLIFGAPRRPSRRVEAPGTCTCGTRSRLSSVSNLSELSAASASTGAGSLAGSSASCQHLVGAKSGLLDSVRWSAANCARRAAQYEPLGAAVPDPEVGGADRQVELAARRGHLQAEPAQSVDSLHGLKFLSMIWIIVIHSYDFALRWSFFANQASAHDNLYKTAASQLLANGTFACDSFFFAAGFLLPYFTYPRRPAESPDQPAAGTSPRLGRHHRPTTCCEQLASRALHDQLVAELHRADSMPRPEVAASPRGRQSSGATRAPREPAQHINEPAQCELAPSNKQVDAGPQTTPRATPPAPLEANRFTGKQLLANLLHRYVRMAPLMMAIIGLSATLLRYLGSGPAWDSSTLMFDRWCRKNWWLNGLFLHNFLRRENMCLSHSWYSAVDMQLFLLGQTLLWVLFRSRKWGLALLGLALVGSQLTTALLTAVNRLPAVPLIAGASEASMNLYYGQVYIKPYCRAAPYLVGMLLAYLMRTSALGSCRLAAWKVALGWACSIATIVAVLLAMQPAMNGRPLGELESALYSSLSRTFWALAIGWMVFACITNHAGPFDLFLSAGFFRPFSRLTYPAFLVHPIVMALFYGSRGQATFHFSHYLMLYLILGNIVITYASALLLSCLFETPFIHMEKILKRYRKRRAQLARAAPNKRPQAGLVTNRDV